MGEGSEWIEASSGTCFGSCETHTNNLSRRQKENRCCDPCTLGEVQGGEEDGCLDPRKACCESRRGLLCLKPMALQHGLIQRREHGIISLA
jgi:hypothetical protein